MIYKKCEDCGIVIDEFSCDRWCEDCFDKGLVRDMNEHWDNFWEQELKQDD